MKGKKFGMFVFIQVIFYCLIIYPTPVKAALKDATISAYADEDAYVLDDSPTSNYGTGDTLKVGESYYTRWETYVHFSFTNRPDNWTKAILKIYHPWKYTNFTCSVYNISNSWDEYSINWNNRPISAQKIANFIFGQTTVNEIDISNYITSEMSEISLQIRIASYSYGYDNAYFYSKDNYDADKKPKIVWTYPRVTQLTVINPSPSDVLGAGTHTIEWSTVGTVDKVRIQLYDGSNFIENIISTEIDNDGEYDWMIDSSDEYYGSHYRVKIIDADAENVYGFSDYFSIDSDASPSLNNNLLTLLFSSFPFILIGVIGVTIIVFLMIQRSQKAKMSMKKEFSVIEEADISMQKQKSASIDTTFCPFCYNKISRNAIKCENCGANL